MNKSLYQVEGQEESTGKSTQVYIEASDYEEAVNVFLNNTNNAIYCDIIHCHHVCTIRSILK